MHRKKKIGTSRSTKVWTAIIVVLLHIVAIAGLVRAFAPDLPGQVIERALSTITVIVTTPTPTPSATPSPEPSPEPDEGAAAEEGKKAKPRPVTAPDVKIPVKPSPAPRASSTGSADRSGAKDAGDGTGAGGEGSGTGSGHYGSGQGGVVARKLEKIAGDISSSKDYPKKTRDLRIGHSVTIVLTVGTDGRVSDCRVTKPSPDPRADAITCELATSRFRFRPAADGAGNPIVGKYAWRQRWFY